MIKASVDSVAVDLPDETIPLQIIRKKNISFDGTAYYWKIRFWDNSDAVGAWSSCNSFTILSPSEQMRTGNYFFNLTTERKFSW